MSANGTRERPTKGPDYFVLVPFKAGHKGSALCAKQQIRLPRSGDKKATSYRRGRTNESVVRKLFRASEPAVAIPPVPSGSGPVLFGSSGRFCLLARKVSRTDRKPWRLFR